MSDKKQIGWTLIGHTAVATFPNGREVGFDLDVITDNNELLVKFYGLKQMLTDKTARPKDERLTDDEKVTVMTEYFDDMTEKGLEVSEKGVITIIGKTTNRTAGIETAIKGEEFTDEERELWAKIKAKAKALKK